MGGVDHRRRGEPEAYRAELCGHRPTLVHCLRNVVDNAIQHGASGGVLTICAAERVTRTNIASAFLLGDDDATATSRDWTGRLCGACRPR